jgi:hypothetical protein
VPRTITIFYPDSRREYWFTDQVFEPGDLLQRDAGPGSSKAWVGRTRTASTPPLLFDRGDARRRARSWR